MPHMYILKCIDDSYYTGSTKNLDKRVWEHQNGIGANYTRKRLPVKLVYCEEYDRIDDAFFREKQVQGWSRRKKEALIKQNPNDLKKSAECQNESHYRGFDSAQPPDSDFTSNSHSISSQPQELTKNKKMTWVPERSRRDKNSTKLISILQTKNLCSMLFSPQLQFTNKFFIKSV